MKQQFVKYNDESRGSEGGQDLRSLLSPRCWFSGLAPWLERGFENSVKIRPGQ